MATLYIDSSSFNNMSVTGSFLVSGSAIFNNPINVTAGFTSSLSGTASYATNFVSASYITSSNIFGPFGSNSILSSSYSVSSSFTSTSDFAYKSYNPIAPIYSALGSTILYQPLGLSLSTINNIAAANFHVNGQLKLITTYIPVTTTITGVKWFQIAKGVFTASNYNGVGLYSYSAGNLTCVVSSSNDGTVWQTATLLTMGSKSFASPYVASPGTYFIASLINYSGVTTSASIAQFAPTALSSGVVSWDYTNTANINSTVTSQTTLPTSLAMSSTTINTTVFPYFALY